MVLGFWIGKRLISAVYGWWLNLRREGRRNDIAGLADLLIADDAAELVFADFALAGDGGWRVVIHGEADALGHEQAEGGFALAAHVNVHAVHAALFGAQAHAAGQALSGAGGLVGGGVEAAAGECDRATGDRGNRRREGGNC